MELSVVLGGPLEGHVEAHRSCPRLSAQQPGIRTKKCQENAKKTMENYGIVCKSMKNYGKLSENY